MRASGAAFHSLGDPRCDTGSPHGRLLSTLLPAIAEFEGELSESVLVKAVNVPKLLLSGTNLPATPCCGRIEAVRALSQTSAPVSSRGFLFRVTPGEQMASGHSGSGISYPSPLSR